jgi:small subunit ribosomal protein S20
MCSPGSYDMANIASQKKRILRSERERSENRLLTSTVKTHFRRLESAVEGGDATTVASEHRDLVSKIDKAVQKGAMHKNTGARKKSKASRIATAGASASYRAANRRIPASLLGHVRSTLPRDSWRCLVFAPLSGGH